jgi:hypothetical protein
MLSRSTYLVTLHPFLEIDFYGSTASTKRWKKSISQEEGANFLALFAGAITVGIVNKHFILQ